MKRTKKPIFAKLRPEFVMSPEDIAALNSLPDNLPETKLTAKQRDLVFSLHHKYLENKVTIGWGTNLYEVEQREKWPSGPRVKIHEAMRMILGNLAYLNSKPELTAEDAASLFYGSLTCRKTYTKLIQSAYQINDR